MTAEQTSLPIAKTEHDRAQWRLETMQLVNWGGFQSHHTVRIAPGSTLLSGASGTGKSTLLDAWIALMMPSNVDFNGASNDTGGGRARSGEKRNLLSYLRGKRDTKSDGSGSTHELLLRGREGQPVWGAIACTFVNDNGRKYTVLRAFFVRAGATANSDVTTTFAAMEGFVDLHRLIPLAASRFDKRALRSAVPGLVIFHSFREFEENMHTRLGIGGGDGGRKAMRLLAQVQAGMQISRVDDLYKSMVLEKPITYLAADDALAHFADLKASYVKMLDEANKEKALRRLPNLQNDLSRAQAHADLIGGMGVDRDGPTPFQLWRLRTERGLLDTAVEVNRSEHAQMTTTYDRARKDETEHESRLAEIAEEKRAHGGDLIEERRRRITDLENSRDDVYRANLKFQTRTEAIGLAVPESADQFAGAQAEAKDFLAAFAERELSLQNEAATIQEEELAPLTAAQRDLFEEKLSLQGRSGAVPRRLHEARMRMAEAAGLDPSEDLPFVAELIDVLPDEEHWRKAVENTLGGIARTVLVDRRTRDRLSAAIDGVTIRPRIRFQAVTLAAHEEWRGDPDHVSGKLAFKDSPFSGWVQDRVSADGTDHLCVPNATSLGGRGPRVTPAGQTRDGDRGAHGESGDGYIIGFSNERRLAAIDAKLTELEPRVGAVRDRITGMQKCLTELRDQKDAYVYVQDTEWATIDHLGIDRRINGLRNEIHRLRATNEVLDLLEKEEEKIRPLHDKANNDRVLAQHRLKGLEKEHGDLVDAQDSVQDAIDAIETRQETVVSEEQQHRLDGLYTSIWRTSDRNAFGRCIAAMRKQLLDEAAASMKTIQSTQQAMEDMFTQYKARWTENNLGTSVESAGEYREILERIRSEGLHERREQWRREFTAWSSDDLLRLSEAFEIALEDIEERLRPVNRILEDLPFGGKGHLQINLRRLPAENVSRFRRELRQLSSRLAEELTEAQIASRFQRLSAFMEQIAVTAGSTVERDRYLDVRQHVVVTARCIDEHGTELASYDHIAGKSGGEMQELVAFIVGSALRYQLGDEDRSRPRFAPVFLDEAFIKADGEFAGRAVAAWQNLGFQLVVGAPFDKVTSLEQPMELRLEVAKNSRGHSFVLELLDADQGTA
ncbi:ATP-binding protein [Glutamicibacter endophyticus]|uniref:ATP-binding protein n=1 Tax=Glutamicibacter endophyticus TaxID=1522174 RepID=UPI003AF0D737